ncbi:MAG: class I SAM-dependent methyltransferase, partial [Aquificaceae bacterium]
KNIEYMLCEEDHMPLEDRAVSVSLLANLFHELLKPEDFLEEVGRITSHRIILIDWHPVHSPAGPPLEERVPEDEVLSFMEKRGFKLLERHSVFPYHYFLIFRAKEA